MNRRYDSFLLRCWQLGGERRIEVEHLQSAGRTRTATFAGAAGWIGERCDDSNDRMAATQSVVVSEEARIGAESTDGEERIDEAATDVPGRASA